MANLIFYVKDQFLITQAVFSSNAVPTVGPGSWPPCVISTVTRSRQPSSGNLIQSTTPDVRARRCDVPPLLETRERRPGKNMSQYLCGCSSSVGNICWEMFFARNLTERSGDGLRAPARSRHVTLTEAGLKFRIRLSIDVNKLFNIRP